MMNNTYLYHPGIKGQRWGVRRYQNSDGTLTAEGKAKKKKKKSIVKSYTKAMDAASLAISKLSHIAVKAIMLNTVDDVFFRGAGKKALKYTGRAAVTVALKAIGHRDIHWYD